MARAKQTGRTEARRRYRAEQAALAAAEPGAEGTEPSRPAPAPKSQAAAAPAVRPGVMSSLRGAYRPVHLVDDLRAAPSVFMNWGFLATVAGTVAAVVWFIVVYNPGMEAIPVGTATPEQVQTTFGSQVLPFFLVQNILQPPPIIGAFVIGFTAKRASWLGGLVYGMLTTILLIIVLQTPAGRLLTNDGAAQPYIVQSAALAPMGAALFASALAWYRRFLQLASPGRQAQKGAVKGRGTPKQKDRPLTSRASKR